MDGQSGFEVLAHESSHFIDHQVCYALTGKKMDGYFSEMPINDVKFSDVIRDEVKEKTKAVQKQLIAEYKRSGSKGKNPSISDARLKIAMRIKQENELMDYAALSDILEGATYGIIRLGYGHGTKYWKREWRDSLALEAFAEMSVVFTSKKALAVMKKELPKSYNFFRNT